MARAGAPVETLTAAAYTMPTDAPESDGTFAWDRTTVIVVELQAGGQTGLGYSYTAAAAVPFIREALAPAVRGRDALDIPGAWTAMARAARNVGRPGLGATAISAVDAALWDLKAKLLGVSLAALLGRVRDSVPLYGSGGFTSYDERGLREQLGRWTAEGFRWVKMKVGTEPERDLARVRAARDAVGGAGLFVDANGAYARKEALAFAETFAELGVVWFEEPVSSDDIPGLRLLRDRGPVGMEIAAGEYGWNLFDLRRLIEAGAVDVLQADATRCLGISGFLQAGALCEAWSIDLSAHCAPTLHLALGCALPRLRHLEWFHDHARIEAMLFDGAPRPERGTLRPNLERLGLGVELKRRDAARYAA